MRDSFDNEKLIGLIVGGISNEFSKEVINGVVNSIPNSSNVRLAILPGELMVQSFQSEGISEHHSMFNSVYNLFAMLMSPFHTTATVFSCSVK